MNFCLHEVLSLPYDSTYIYCFVIFSLLSTLGILLAAVRSATEMFGASQLHVLFFVYIRGISRDSVDNLEIHGNMVPALQANFQQRKQSQSVISPLPTLLNSYYQKNIIEVKDH